MMLALSFVEATDLQPSRCDNLATPAEIPRGSMWIRSPAD